MKSKPFTDGEFIKHCLSFVSDILCPNVSLSARTVTRRIEKHSIQVCIFFNRSGQMYRYDGHCTVGVLMKTSKFKKSLQ